MTLNDFYKNVLVSLGLEEKDGYIYTKDSSGNLLPLMDNQKQLVLPTKDQLKDLLEETEDGEVIVARLPYNPLNEDVVKGDSTSLKKTKLIVERRIGHNLALVGELLLTLASNKTFQKKTNMELNKFLASINEAKTPNIKQVVDDLSIEKWTEIYKATLSNVKGMVSIFLKKAGKATDGEKYNRLAVMDSEVYNQLLEANKDTPVYGVKLRNKDITIFKLLIEYLLPDMNSNGCVEVGSNDTDTPAFIALYRMYINITKRTNRLLELLKHVNAEAEKSIVELPITEEDLVSLNMFKQELNMIPSEVDLNRTRVLPTRRIANLDGSVYNRNVGTNTNVAANYGNVRQANNYGAEVHGRSYPQHTVDYAPTEVEDPVDRIFSKLNTTITPVRNSPFTQQPSNFNQGGFSRFGNGFLQNQQPAQQPFGFNQMNRFGNGFNNGFGNNAGFGSAISSFNPAFR